MPRKDGPQVCAETTTGAAEVDTAAPDIQREIARCRDEIAAIEALVRGGHPDVEGLCLALSDWSAELRILEGLPWKNKFFES